MKIGIVGYGVYIPRQRIATEKIVRIREKRRKDLKEFIEKVRYGLLLRYKAIADPSEDTVTMAIEAAENAVLMAGIEPSKIGSVTVGTESKPYAVGSTARHVASFIGAKYNVYVSDLEGACNSGMQGLEFIKAQVASGDVEYGLAIGSDVAQAPEGDPLEYAAGAGAGAFIIGKGDVIATIEDVATYSSLMMDFWRREGSPVPKHFGKTTVEAYIKHVVGAIINLLKKRPKLSLNEFDQITFHQPSGYVPLKTCKSLIDPRPPLVTEGDVAERIKLTMDEIEEKVKPWLKVLDVGNTYAASTMIGLASILDSANPGDNILAVSYGSGAYSIATWIKVGEKIKEKVGLVPTVEDYIKRRKEISFQVYKAYLKERLHFRKRLLRPKVIGEIEPVGKEAIELILCDGCKRMYYPSVEKCLQYDCEGPAIVKSFPRRARLKSFNKALSKGSTQIYDILREGRVPLVDCDFEELKEGMDLELVIRRLNYEGTDGLILYGPSYRPAFRKTIYPYK
ncbi:TPA: hydroxymethylglutaryl-CoA synthase [Candidatus Bathyarchaeota archaeon]|nr:hydroxymethylglutaryl-CoA synthase [Candidatus Bathyarchaeota archaeon]